MLRSETLFGKREPNSTSPNSPLTATSNQPGGLSGAPRKPARRRSVACRPAAAL